MNGHLVRCITSWAVLVGTACGSLPSSTPDQGDLPTDSQDGPGRLELAGSEDSPGGAEEADLTTSSDSAQEVLPGCPVPIVVVEEGEEVLPQTVVHLHGEASTSPNGDIVRWNWTVDGPGASRQRLQPSDSAASPTLEADVAGNYTFCLGVCDGLRCSTDLGCAGVVCREVVVCPCGNFGHVELTWDTPQDPDPTDQGPAAGADMDLHVLYANPPDGSSPTWFDPRWDAYAGNPGAVPPSPPSESPWATLDRDDSDGFGPENVTFQDVAQDAVIRFGVYYRDEHSMGGSFPRVRLYWHGALLLDRDLGAVGGPAMRQCDFWDVGSMEFPEGVAEATQTPEGGLAIRRMEAYPECVIAAAAR